MKSIWKWTVMLSLVGMVASGCKSTNGSDTQSLDNFARKSGASLTENQCKGDFDLMTDLFSPDLDMINIHAKDQQTATQLQSKVESALKAVPTQIQMAFFGLGGIVEVSSLTHDICSQGLSKEQKDRHAEFGSKITGCWKYQTDYQKLKDNTLTKDSRVVIYIDANPASIEHSLVRTFGYVLSQVLVKLDHQEGKPEVKQIEGDAKFEAAKEEITLAFLDDVSASDGLYELSRYESLIGKGVLSKDKMERGTAWTKLVTERPQDAKAFMDYVFAEAFDSQYCSPETKKVMNSDFKNAATAFQPVHESITGLKKSIDEVNSESEIAVKEGDDEKDAETASAEPQPKPAQPEAEAPKDNATPTDYYGSGYWKKAGSFELAGIFGGFFRGVGRVIRGIARGVFHVARAVVRGAAMVARAAVRIAAGVIRATGRVIFHVVRGAARVIRGVVVGAGRLIVGAARLTLAVGRAVVRTAGTIVYGVFGPQTAFATESGMVLEDNVLDQDNDGIEDSLDLCSNTPSGASVHKSNKQWLGCAGGQFRDQDRVARSSQGSYQPTYQPTYQPRRRGLFGRRR
jgi:hypothetical protein